MPTENFKDNYQLNLDELVEKLRTTSVGLTNEVATERLSAFEPNQLREEQKRNPMVILLLIAALVSGVALADHGVYRSLLQPVV